MESHPSAKSALGWATRALEWALCQIISLDVNHLRRGVQRAMDADFLPFELTYFSLTIDVIDRPSGVLLKHVLISLLHDGARKGLDAGLVGD